MMSKVAKTLTEQRAPIGAAWLEQSVAVAKKDFSTRPGRTTIEAKMSRQP